MAFRKHELTQQVKRNPREAARTILDAYERTGFRVDVAAKRLGVHSRTLSRWIVALRIDEKIRKARVAYRERRAAS